MRGLEFDSHLRVCELKKEERERRVGGAEWEGRGTKVIIM